MDSEYLTAYLAPEGFTDDLVQELSPVKSVRGRLVLTDREPQAAAWAQNVWLSPQWIPISSIKDGVRALKGIQRNWVNYSCDHFRRSTLIQEQLPRVSARPIEFLGPVPQAPLGSWTLWDKDLILASPQCSSPFPHGEVQMVEDKENPPSRAYLKLWELFTAHGVRPEPGQVCMDLGSSPGGWTWVLQQMGANVISVDKADLVPELASHPKVRFLRQSAFALEPADVGPVDWLFSDIICYPERLWSLVEKWKDHVPRFVCTIKFQGPTDFSAMKKFASVPGSRLIHLSHNKHELTWISGIPKTD